MEYEGEMKDGVPHGQGIKKWPNGNMYQGPFVSGKAQGNGSHFWAKDSKKVEGIMAGDMYIGQFNDNHIHGDGNRYTKSGKVFVEKWETSQRVSCVEDLSGSEVPALYKDTLARVEAFEAGAEGLGDAERIKLQALLGGAKSQAMKLFSGKTSDVRRIEKDSLSSPNTTVVFKQCVNCHYTIGAYCTKVVIQGCQNCTFVFQSKILTCVLEVYQCTQVNLEIATAIKTLQLDMCDGVSVAYDSEKNMQDVVWAGVEKLSVQVQHSVMGTLSHTSGFSQILGEFNNITMDRKEHEQFIIRVIRGKLVQERLVRLANGFPTTERETAEFERREEANIQKLAKDAGITIGRKQDPAKALIGRNDKCVCGSGKKYKKCCGINA